MEINLDWQGPYSRDGALKVTGIGLYQYTGMHDVYGPATLLYLGKASDNWIVHRLTQHVHHSWSSFPVKILIGKVAAENNLPSEDHRQQIDLAERLLIYTHSPAWNSQHIKSLKWEKIPENLHIFIWGVRGHLLPEVSVRRWREVGNAIPERLRPIEG